MRKLNLLILLLFIIFGSFLLIVNCPTLPADDDPSLPPETNIIKTVDSSTYTGYSPSMAVSGKNIYISYLEYPNHYLKFAKSTDGGETWPSANIKTVDSTGATNTLTNIAVSGANVYIVYTDEVNHNVKLAKSSDSGVTWSAVDIKTVDASGNVGAWTSLAVDGSKIYVAYNDDVNLNLKFNKSSDSGANWYSSTIKTIDTDGDVGQFNSIAYTGTNVLIYYLDFTTGALKVARSLDEGDTWLPAYMKTVDSSVLTVGWYTSIATSGIDVFVSYMDTTNYDLKIAISTNTGSTWLPDNIQTIDNSHTGGAYTSIAVNMPYVYISYLAGTKLKFIKSSNGGTTWPAANIKTVDNAVTPQFSTSIKTQGSKVYIAYQDSVNMTLKFAKSVTRGDSWAP